MNYPVGKIFWVRGQLGLLAKVAPHYRPGWAWMDFVVVDAIERVEMPLDMLEQRRCQ